MPLLSVGGKVHIHYEAYGNPTHPAIFLCHGAGGNSAVWWRNIPYMVNRGYYVVTHDARFFGSSSKDAAAAEGFEIGRTFARDAVAILDELKVQKAAFVCQSMGGACGIFAAVEFPDRVWALVMCNSCAGMELPPDIVAIRDATLKANASAFASNNRGGASLGGKALGSEFQRRNPELAFWYGINSQFNALGALHKATGTNQPEVSIAKARRILVPALVISSDYDPFFPPEVLSGAAKLIGNGAEVKHFPGHGHSVYFEDPDGFNYALMDFLHAVIPGAPGSRL